jgi:excisionase family DNA binding protein
MTGLLTARVVAGCLGVSTETVLRWTRAGKLPAIRLPSGQSRYREADLEGLLTGRVMLPATLVATRTATPEGD